LFRRGGYSSGRRNCAFGFEQLEPRRVLAASAAFNSATGALTVSDASPSDNNILISFQVLGDRTLVVVTDQGTDILPGDVLASNVKSIVVAAAGGNDTVSLSFVASAQFTQLFQTPIVDGGDGNDTIFGSKLSDLLYGVGGDDKILGLESDDHLYGGEGVDQIFGDYGSNNAPNSGNDFLYGENGDDLLVGDQGNDTLLGFGGADQLFGNDGNDNLQGMDGDDLLFGNLGNDTLLGLGGLDQLFGNDGSDVLTGGDGDDQAFGGAGDDRMIWNPGDETDLNEGEAGSDATVVNGGNGAEVFTATANGARVRFDRLDPAPFSIDIGTTENLVVNANGGNDSFSATGNLAALIQITVDGGANNDTILGSNGADLLFGGDGNDFIDGQQGNDTARLGAGDDVFQWDPGDGSDIVEGQDGGDTMLFNGNTASEVFEVSALGQRVLFTRNIANITMDLNDVETIGVNAGGGADTITVNDLTGTDTKVINADLAGTIGGSTGDAQADVIIVNGTNSPDVVELLGAGTSFSVNGLHAVVSVTNSEGVNDNLVINGLGGNDEIGASALPAGVVNLTIDGGDGNDTLRGSQGADVFLGGDDNDSIFGDNGNDLALMGAGDDTFRWDPGDGNDTLEGQAGADTLLFVGSDASENIDISANGGRVLFFRDIANVTMDLDDVETIDYKALGGADNIVVGDLSGTDATTINVDLAGTLGGSSGDGQADTVTVSGTQGADTFGAAGDAASVNVFGLQAAVNILSPEQANDRLTLNGLGGDDVIDATSLEPDAIQLTMNAGLGADLMLGSAGGDLFNGGDGNDTALMGAGNDTFVWNPGDDNDTLEGQAGTDTMLFNASNAAENIDISANGGRVLFFRDVANVTMDLNDVEVIDFNALGGADNIVVNDLSGTDMTDINLNLAGTLGGNTGDSQADNIIINGTAGDDVVLLTGDDGSVSVIGLAARVDITTSEVANDRVTVNTLAGDDVIEGSGLSDDAILLTGDGGANNDVLLGGAGNDILLGGDGDDVLLGGPGLDVLDGGPGDDVEIQD
jgi:Ca2+-binding RTX toxin-like protein